MELKTMHYKFDDLSDEDKWIVICKSLEEMTIERAGELFYDLNDTESEVKYYLMDDLQMALDENDYDSWSIFEIADVLSRIDTGSNFLSVYDNDYGYFDHFYSPHSGINFESFNFASYFYKYLKDEPVMDEIRRDYEAGRFKIEETDHQKTELYRVDNKD